MAKQRSKQPSTSRKTTRTTPAPKRLTRPADEAAIAIEPTVIAPVTDALPETIVVPEVVPEVVLEVVPEVVPEVVAEAAPAPLPVAPAAPDHQQIARLAFARFVARGYGHGRHVEDWLAAEAELRAAR
ncbi:MAG: DUF2934 domain-containing protein [Myxococcota bacterium]|nr:DUF2934 domain-containing protein [Myxococcota bacterium]